MSHHIVPIMEQPKTSDEITAVNRKTADLTIQEAYDPSRYQYHNNPTPTPQTTRAYSQTANGDLEAPDTECWNHLLDQPLKHVLLCNHEHETETPQPCGPACKTSKFAESKARGGGFVCWKGWCGKNRRRYANVNIFISKKPAKKAQNAKREVKKSGGVSNELFVGEGEQGPRVEKRKTRLPSERKMSSKALSNALMKHEFGTDVDVEEQELIHLNATIEADPALKMLVASQIAPAGRRKSKLHSGYALKAEREAEDREASLHRSMAKLGGVGRRGRAANDPSFAMPDFPVGEGPVYGGDQAAAVNVTPRRSARIRNVLTKIDEGHEEGAEDHNSEDELDGEAEMQGVRGVRSDGTYYQDENICAVCETPAYEILELCIGCDRAFHPSCLGVESVERCADCTERRIANEALANKTFTKTTKLKSIADIRAFNLRKRLERKAELEEKAALAPAKSHGFNGDGMDID